MARRADIDDMPAPLRIGSKAAPVGSEDWAAFCRLELHSMVDDLRKNAERIDGYIALFHSHRAWTMLKDDRGRSFAKWDEFCSTPQPFGLGRPWPELKPALEAALVSARANEKPGRVLQLVTVAPAQEPAPIPAGPGRGHKAPRPEGGSVSDSGGRHEQRVRAIAERAPEPVQELYRQDLIGQKEAARLGPKDPTPEQAAKIGEIAKTVTEFAKNEAKEAGARVAKQRVSAKVRELLGDEPEDQISKLLKTIKKLSADDLARLFEGLRAAYGAEFGETK